MLRFSLLCHIGMVSIAATLMAGCDSATKRPSENAIARFQNNLGVGSLIFRIDRSYNGSQSVDTSYEVRQVADIEGDYVLTRRVARVDGRYMTKQDYKDLMEGIGDRQIRQWRVMVSQPKQEPLSSPAFYYAYRAELIALQKTDPGARFYIQCNKTIEDIYSRSGILTQGELQFYRSWWNVEGDKKVSKIGNYIEEVTPPVAKNSDSCRDFGDWLARLKK